MEQHVEGPHQPAITESLKSMGLEMEGWATVIMSGLFVRLYIVSLVARTDYFVVLKISNEKCENQSNGPPKFKFSSNSQHLIRDHHHIFSFEHPITH